MDTEDFLSEIEGCGEVWGVASVEPADITLDAVDSNEYFC